MSDSEYEWFTYRYPLIGERWVIRDVGIEVIGRNVETSEYIWKHIPIIQDLFTNGRHININAITRDASGIIKDIKKLFEEALGIYKSPNVNTSISAYKHRHDGAMWIPDIYILVRSFLSIEDRLNLCIAKDPPGLIDYRPDPDKYEYRPNPSYILWSLRQISYPLGENFGMKKNRLIVIEKEMEKAIVNYIRLYYMPNQCSCINCIMWRIMYRN